MITIDISCDKYEAACVTQFGFGDIYFQVEYNPRLTLPFVVTETRKQYCTTCFEALIAYKISNGILYDIQVVEQKNYIENIRRY